MEDPTNRAEARLDASVSSSGSSGLSFLQSDSLGSWIVTLVLFCIPPVNIIYAVMLLIGVGGSVAKVNMVRACLILAVAGFIIVAVFFGSLASMFARGY